MRVTSPWGRAAALAAALALVGTACGRSSGQKESSRSSSTSAASASSSPAKATSADFGDQKNVCQGGSPKGSPDQGVTSGEIHVATFSDPGFSGRQGLNQELFDTAEVFERWCNDHGGINGRKVVVDEKDAALFNVKPRMAEACAQDFVMAGGGAVFDQDGVDDRLRCLLPDIAGYLVTPKARGADLAVQPVPNGLKTEPVGDLRWLADKYPDSTKAVASLTGDIPATKIQSAQYKEGAQSLGWKFVYDDAYPAAGATTWTPYAQAIKSAGAKGLIYVGEPENLAKLMQAFSDIGYALEWVRADPNHYDQNFVKVGGTAIRHVYIRSVFWPLEKASRNSATKAYLDLFARYKPSGKSRTYLGLQAMSAWLLFAQAARDCGDNLTRRCVYEKASQVTDWTGGGLHARQDPKDVKASECYLIEEATPTGFVTPNVKPNESIYNCDPKNIYVMKGNYGQGATLASVGKSLADLR